MKTISKRVLMPHGDDRAPLCGFVGYVDHHKPILLRRIGYEIANDIHDAFSDQTSQDNGRTWTDLRPSLGKKPVDGGYICHTENALLLLPDGRLMHFTNDKFERSLDGCDASSNCSVRITTGTAAELSRGEGESVVSDYGLRQGLCVSFVQPIIDRRGRILAPVQWQKEVAGPHGDPQWSPPTRTDMPDVFADYWQVGLLIGEPAGDGYAWRRVEAVPFDAKASTRGMCEGAIAELVDGSLVMALRASNAHQPDRPNYEWVSRSTDGGETWSKAAPLPCTDGSLLESPATGSMFFRSITDGRLYWIGNLCTEGRRPNGNNPRSPLHIVRMNENPLSFERDSITVIDRAQSDEHPDTQHSNFKLYQDRETGDVLIYLTRYGQRGYDNGIWIRADLYEYRVAMS